MHDITKEELWVPTKSDDILESLFEHPTPPRGYFKSVYANLDISLDRYPSDQYWSDNLILPHDVYPQNTPHVSPSIYHNTTYDITLTDIAIYNQIHTSTIHIA